MSSPLPDGTVTFLFTDIEGSTRLLSRLGSSGYASLLEAHRRIVRAAAQAHEGVELGGEGDSLLFVFPRAAGAVEAARLSQPELVALGLSVRMGLHTGEPLLVSEEYVGLDVHRAARIAAAAHGGQILLSDSSARMLNPERLRDLGDHRMKDLVRPERIYQLLGPGLCESFPPIRSLSSFSHNLPVQPTALIGREAELKEISERLGRPEVRALTLTGPAGTGKTRLALQVAAELLDDFPDGVFFVGLAPLTDASLVRGAVLQTLGISGSEKGSLSCVLRDAIGSKRILLLLDNLEHVTGAAPLLAEALTGAPGVTLLGTSRVPLRIRGEWEYPVAPLSLPTIGDPVSVDDILRYSAVKLFVERARAVRPEFTLLSENASAVVSICRGLDGIPLAIELAAARVRVLSPDAILNRLSSRFRLLVGGARDLPPRHQTLHNAIAWSHDLLTEEAATLFRRLGVFTGSFSLEAIESVCDEEDASRALDGAALLVENSLLRWSEEVLARLLERLPEFRGTLLQRKLQLVRCS